MNMVHARQYADWHTEGQVRNDTLRAVPFGPLTGAMAFEFQTALKWHMDRHGTKIVDLVKATGVSRDVVNKLLGRESASTVVENAMLIAAYYGKSVNQFIQMVDIDQESRSKNLFDMLSPSERQLMEAQIQGILRLRAGQSA